MHSWKPRKWQFFLTKFWFSNDGLAISLQTWVSKSFYITMKGQQKQEKINSKIVPVSPQHPQLLWCLCVSCSRSCMRHNVLHMSRLRLRYTGYRLLKLHPGMQVRETWRLHSVYWRKGSCLRCSRLWRQL